MTGGRGGREAAAATAAATSGARRQGRRRRCHAERAGWPQKRPGGGGGRGRGGGGGGGGGCGPCAGGGPARAPASSGKRRQRGSKGCGRQARGRVGSGRSRACIRLDSTKRMILADQVSIRGRAALPVKERADPAGRCHQAWPQRSVSPASGRPCEQERYQRSVGSSRKSPRIASMILWMSRMRVVGMRGATGE